MAASLPSEPLPAADSASMPEGVFKHREGNWGFRAEARGGSGRRQTKRVGFTSMAAAYNARIQFLAGKLQPAPGRSLSLSEWFAIQLEAVRETRRATTASNCKFAFDRIDPYLGDVALEDLSEDLLRDMYRKMALKYTSDTLASTHGRLRAALRAAVREHKLERCVADNVTPPPGQPSRPRRTWTFEQLATFSRHVGAQRDKAMWLAWITTGLRRGEMCGLLWPKVSLTVNELTVDWQRTTTAEGQIVEGSVKTRSGIRVVPINDDIVAALREWKSVQSEQRLRAGDAWAGGEYVFTTQEGRPYHPSSFDDRLSKLAEAAGLPRLTPHELRHTFASRCLEMGMSVKLVSSMLGHSKVETTQISTSTSIRLWLTRKRTPSLNGCSADWLARGFDR